MNHNGRLILAGVGAQVEGWPDGDVAVRLIAKRRRRKVCSLAAAGILVATSCSSNSTSGDSATKAVPDDELVYESKVMSLFADTTLMSSPDQGQEAIAACMVKRGWEYTPIKIRGTSPPTLRCFRQPRSQTAFSTPNSAPPSDTASPPHRRRWSYQRRCPGLRVLADPTPRRTPTPTTSARYPTPNGAATSWTCSGPTRASG